MFHKARSEVADRRDPMQEFADRIISELEKGVKPWVRPWDPDKCLGPQAPFNPTSGKPYHGVNVMILGMHEKAFESGDPRFCTYQQAAEQHWQVRKGEKSTTIFFYKPLEIKDERAEDGSKVIPILKSYAVFHASQIDGIPEFTPPTVEEAPWRSDEAAALIMRNSGVAVRVGGDRAFYSPATDHIQIPPTLAFKSVAEEACTHLHELGHASGAKHRMNRDLTGKFGSAAYAMEELFVELASSFVGTQLNLPADIPNHASYIDHWLKPLNKDRKLIFHAAAEAQRIATWTLNLHPDYAATHSHETFPDRPTPRASASLETLQPTA